MDWTQTDTKRPIGRAYESWGGIEMLPVTLFDFAYFPDWIGCVDELARMAQPEPWHFPTDYNPARKGTPEYILGHYIHNTYKNAAIQYNLAADQNERDSVIVLRHDFAAISTGLYTPHYALIYAYFERNTYPGERRWYFRGWGTAGSPLLARVAPLPYPAPPTTLIYRPELPIRCHVAHMLEDAANVERIPPNIREAPMLPLYLETAVELARRQAAISPGIVLPQYYQGTTQFLIPICLTDPVRPDLALVLRPADGYYVGSTMLTLTMAYMNARVIGRPEAAWIKRAFAEVCA